MNNFYTEVLVIGSGVAGLLAAELQSTDKNVTIITKSTLGKSNSMLAQGGIAAVTTDDDSWQEHFFDTLQAGVFHNDKELTELLAKRGFESVQQLIDLGVSFDKNDDGSYALCREGAHSAPRIFHAGGDATGKELVETLMRRVHKSCDIIENHLAVDLIVQDGVCSGAWFIDPDGNRFVVSANTVILATGGAGQLYPVTSNDATVTGDGLAMAYRAGARLSDLEFMQFHPTMFAGDHERTFLLSEAVRGEGGILVTDSGERIMEGKHPLGDLAPRDVVARAIFEERCEVYLDVSRIPHFQKRFPTISSYLEKNNMTLQSGRIPVRPGAHFLMGGVETDRYGRTSISNLFALGEVANTRVHGANRLASNSLLEAVVFANEAASWISSNPVPKRNMINQQQHLLVPQSMPDVSVLRKIMNENVGITRSAEGLSAAIDELDGFLQGKKVIASNRDEVVTYNMLQTGWLMATSAYMRKESRGGHFRTDFPHQNKSFQQKRIIRRVVEDEQITIGGNSRAIF